MTLGPFGSRLFLLSALTLALTGCSLSTTAAPSAVQGVSLQGKIHGGQQPIVGAHVFLLAASTAGFGHQSVSVLTSGDGQNDGSGLYFFHALANAFYVTTDASGSFSLTGNYTCTAGDEIYLLAVGGDSGHGENSVSTLMTLLGDCPALVSSSDSNFNDPSGANYIPFLYVNEVTTVAAAYTLSPFGSDVFHIAATSAAAANHPKSTLAITNGFNTFNNLVDRATGIARTAPPNDATGVVPQDKIDTIANFMAACVNSDGSTGAGSSCGTYLNDASGAPETASAAIGLAQNAGFNVPDLFTLQTGVGAPFQPALSSAPNDITITIKWSGGGIDHPNSLAVDGSGNVWVTNGSAAAHPGITKIAPYAVNPFPLGANGSDDSGALTAPQAIAIDPTDNILVANGSHVYEFDGSANQLLDRGGYTSVSSIAADGAANVWIGDSGAQKVLNYLAGSSLLNTSDGLFPATSLALDFAGHVWASDSNANVDEITSLTPDTFNTYDPSSIFNVPQGITVDGLNNVWVADKSNSGIVELDNTGALVANYTVSNMHNPVAIALDGYNGFNGNNIWVANGFVDTSYYIVELNSSGFPVSGFSTNGYQTGSANAPNAIAVDLSGNVWYTNTGESTVQEIVGQAVPVVTPIAASLASPYTVPNSMP